MDPRIIPGKNPTNTAGTGNALQEAEGLAVDLVEAPDDEPPPTDVLAGVGVAVAVAVPEIAEERDTVELAGVREELDAVELISWTQLPEPLQEYPGGQQLPVEPHFERDDGITER